MGWIALGVGSSVWVLRLSYRPAPGPPPLSRRGGGASVEPGPAVLSKVERHAVVETQHAGSLSHLTLQPRDKLLITAGEDSKVKLWTLKVRKTYKLFQLFREYVSIRREYI